jgi:hypothetical protein
MRPHLTGAQVAIVPAQRLAQQARCVASVRQSLGAVEVVQQQRLVVRRGALLDDQVGALARRKSAQIGQTLFSNNYGHVVLGVVHVGRQCSRTASEHWA